MQGFAECLFCALPSHVCARRIVRQPTYVHPARNVRASSQADPSAASATGGSAPPLPPHQRSQLLGAAAVVASLSAAAAAVAAEGTDSGSTAVAAAAAAAASGYVPGPVEVGWEVWAGFVAGVVPFLIASYEFGKRILIQRRCPACRGRGLVQRGRYLRKCSECGGLLPWLGWRYFLLGTADPGNGGFLLQPKGQKSVFYTVPPPLPRDGARTAPAQQPGDSQDAEVEQAQQPQQGQGEQDQRARTAASADEQAR